jgi:hypothetical protein
MSVQSGPVRAEVAIESPIFLQELDAGEVNAALREQMALFDTGPLFLPTRWNAAAASGQSRSEITPGEIFPLYDARFAQPEGAAAARMAAQPPQQRLSLDEFTGGGDSLRAFGRVDRAPLAPSQRLAVLEIRQFDTGRLALTLEVRAEAEAASRWPDWSPAEFALLVHPEGMFGPPQLSRSSGVEEVDSFLRAHFESLPPLEWGLEPGYYRVLYGP